MNNFYDKYKDYKLPDIKTLKDDNKRIFENRMDCLCDECVILSFSLSGVAILEPCKICGTEVLSLSFPKNIICKDCANKESVCMKCEKKILYETY